jgi:hypothetical protein
MTNSRKSRFTFLAARVSRDYAITRIHVRVSVACDFMSGEGSPRLELVRQSLRIFTREKDHANMQKVEGPSEAQPSQVALMTPRQTHTAATTEDGPVAVT